MHRRFLPRLLATVAIAVPLLTLGAGAPGVAGASPLWSPAMTAVDLNLRAGPGIGYEVLAVMPPGAEVSALTEEPQNGFVRVRYGDLEGWASTAYLVVGGEPMPGPTATVREDLNLRAGPGFDYDVLTVMPAGAVVTVHDMAGDGFVRVTYEGIAGWAYGAYLAKQG